MQVNNNPVLVINPDSDNELIPNPNLDQEVQVDHNIANNADANANANNVNAINNNANDMMYNNSISSSDLHEAILANSRSVVELLLEQGANPNRSPQLAPVGVIAASSSERARDLHRSLGRVFRSRQGGTIHPLHVAVCNAYHHCVFGRTEAIGIVNALLKAGADRKSTCSGIAFCKVGTHPTVTIASSKTCDKVALFLKRFPLVTNLTECCTMMDEVATLILQQDDHGASSSDIYGAASSNNYNGPQQFGGHHARNDSFSHFPTTASNTTTTPVICTHTLGTWNKLLDDDSFTDLIFKCPDGQVGAHRSVLIAAVPYFATALQGPWREGTQTQSDDDDGDESGDDCHSTTSGGSNSKRRRRNKNITDENNKQMWTTSNSVATMKVIMQFVYTGQVEAHTSLDNSDDGSGAPDIPTLLSVATEYQLQVLQDHYEQELIKGIAVDTIASSLQLAHLHHLSLLKERCLDFCHENATTVLVHPDMLNLSTQPTDVWTDLVEGMASRNAAAASSANKKRKLNPL